MPPAREHSFTAVPPGEKEAGDERASSVLSSKTAAAFSTSINMTITIKKKKKKTSLSTQLRREQAEKTKLLWEEKKAQASVRCPSLVQSMRKTQKENRPLARPLPIQRTQQWRQERTQALCVPPARWNPSAASQLERRILIPGGSFLSSRSRFALTRVVEEDEWVVGATEDKDGITAMNRTQASALVSMLSACDRPDVHSAKVLKSVEGESKAHQHAHIDLDSAPHDAPPLRVEVSALGGPKHLPSFLWVYPDGPERKPQLVRLEVGQSITFSATETWHAGYTGLENGPRLYVLYSEEHVSVKLKAEIVEAAKDLRVSSRE